MPGVDNRRPTRAWALGAPPIQHLLQCRKRPLPISSTYLFAPSPGDQPNPQITCVGPLRNLAAWQRESDSAGAVIPNFSTSSSVDIDFGWRTLYYKHFVLRGAPGEEVYLIKFDGNHPNPQITCVGPLRNLAAWQRESDSAGAVIPNFSTSSSVDIDFGWRTQYYKHFVLRGAPGKVGQGRWHRRVRGTRSGRGYRGVSWPRRERGIMRGRRIGCRSRYRLCVRRLGRERGVRRGRRIGCRSRHRWCVRRLGRERGVGRGRRIGCRCRCRYRWCVRRLGRERGVGRSRRIGCRSRYRRIGRIGG